MVKCNCIPKEIRRALVAMQEQENSNPTKRYPSRMVFFRRVWHRFHYGEHPDGSSLAGGDGGVSGGATEASPDSISLKDVPFEDLVRDSAFVTMEDHGLVLDSQFVALAQMDRCYLKAEDRIGYSKDRPIGFVGLCCRFCGGRPAFGRFFPNSERNLEKTSARDTMVSHVSLFCKEVPEDVRNAVLSLKRIESSKDGSPTMKKLIYGSGKMFFHRVWERLHSEGSSTSGAPEREDSKPAAFTSRRSSFPTAADQPKPPPSHYGQKQPPSHYGQVSVLGTAKNESSLNEDPAARFQRQQVTRSNGNFAAAASWTSMPRIPNNHYSSRSMYADGTSFGMFQGKKRPPQDDPPANKRPRHFW